MTYIIKDFDNFDFNKIIFGERIKTNDDSGKYYIYYLDNEKPKEISIQMPETRLIYNLANHKYSQINVPLYPIWSKINIFINFINNLEEHIKNTLLKKKKKYDFSPLITNKNNIDHIKTNLLNEEEINKTLLNLQINQEVVLIIKISYIWYKKYDENLRYGLSSSLLEIKTNINENICEKNIVKTTPIAPIINPIMPISKLIPSVSDLQNALKLLKKV